MKEPKTIHKYIICFFVILSLSACTSPYADQNNGTQTDGSFGTSVEADPSSAPVDNYGTENTAVNSKTALSAYSEFMQGELSVKYGDEVLWIEDIVGYYKYTIFDINGDKNPELLISNQGAFYYIFAFWSDELHVIWTDRFWSGYSRILCNGAILHIRPGGAPKHNTYHYVVLDSYGEEIQHITFEEYDFDEDGGFDFFLYELEEVPKEEWIKMTEPYLSIGEAEIQWYIYF